MNVSRNPIFTLAFSLLLCGSLIAQTKRGQLPKQYFPLLEAGAAQVEMENLGRLAQDALYFHEGPAASIPQDQRQYAYQMSIPAGIRKTAPWVVALSGIIDTQAINSQFYLDRQAHLGVFHEKLGLIISGANSKQQPELATFSEKLMGQVVHLPLSSRLQMNGNQDRLSLAFNTFFSDLYIPRPANKELSFKFVISGRGTPAEEPRLTLQLCLKAGETLETGAGRKITIGADRIELPAADLGGWIRHHGEAGLRHHRDQYVLLG